MATTSTSQRTRINRPAYTWDMRLDEIGWGLFLLMTGGLWLVPSDRVPVGSWLLGTGALLVGINAVRYFRRAPVNVFTTALGALALSGGWAERTGVELPLMAIAIVAMGILLLLRPLAGRRR